MAGLGRARISWREILARARRSTSSSDGRLLAVITLARARRSGDYRVVTIVIQPTCASGSGWRFAPAGISSMS